MHYTADQKVFEAMKCVSLSGTASCLVTVCVALTSGAGPMNDPVDKRVYQDWVATYGKSGAYDHIASSNTAATRDAFIFRMKAVKDYRSTFISVFIRNKPNTDD